MNNRLKLSIILALFLWPTLALSGERSEAEVSCKATDQKLVYECTISLTGKKSKAPVSDANFTVGADMPSMPGAHNVRPVVAEPMEAAGRYQVRIDLEMMGEWVLLIDLTKPSRDRITKKLHFSEKLVTEVNQSQ